MTKENLDEAIRSAVRDYAAECEAAGRPPVLWLFSQAFAKRAGGANLANSIHKISPGIPWRRYLASVRDVELFQTNLMECIRLRAGAATIKPVSAAADAPCEESCRIAVLMRGEPLPEELMAWIRMHRGGGGDLLQSVRSWAKAARKIRARADKLVAAGETRQDLSFDNLKRDAGSSSTER